ncbi:MAG: 50S ribosomal protein L11 methyltransferase [Ignavibacteriaceae bacterium]|jgi:ribosomal protein L11 methyltransferase|nr:50S ribosomal protein L11 methyltransferase [Ignavibacteriaceae bacterium]
MAKLFKEFIITAEPFNAEILSSVLWELDIDGINEEVNCLKVFTSKENITIKEVENELNHLKENNLLREFSIQENYIQDKNWNEEWEKSREVVRVTNKIVIKPTFKDYEAKPDEIVLTLDPKMSFGTGDHQTTKICLRFIEKYLMTDSFVLDAGSGTAILAIAAAKLDAKKAIAFDIDEWSYENGVENVRLNDAADKVEIRRCELNEIAEKDFDFIVANIQKNILLELAEGFNSRIKNNGLLILSGLLEMDREVIVSEYSSLGFEEIDFMKMDEWIGLVFKKIL